MSKPKQPKGRSGAGTSTGRRSRNTYVTKSGQTIKVNRNVSQRMRGLKDSWQQHRAIRLAGMPKTHLKRFLYRLKPSNLYHYWFSREGAIMALKLFGIFVIVCFVLLVGAFAFLRKDLPAINNIYGQNLGGSITYYDSTGTTVIWQDYNAVKRVPVSSSAISPYMKEATVAIEDKNFYHEGAFSISGIVRAGLHDVIGGGSGLQGASTITEQLVKLNAGYNGSRTIATKLKEIILASEVEKQYTKDDILTGYLNIAPYGGVDYGVESAAEDYFRENASQLTLAQSAMLAAIPQAPTYYSPYSDPVYNSAASENLFGEQALTDRAQYILDQMAKQGYITQSQADAAKQVDVLAQVQPLQTKYTGVIDPYFVLSAKQQLENTYGAATVSRGGWKVITTLNMPIQNLANELVQKNLPLVKANHGDEEAVVAESTQTGKVDALVGGVDFNNPTYGQINYAETKIPPGSSFKPYDYSTLINDTNNVGAGSLIYDVRQPLPGYPCTTGALQPLQGGNCLEDYDFKFPGAEELRYALAGSRNVPAVKAMLSVIPNKQCIAGNLGGCVPSINKVISTADAMMDVPNAYKCYSDAALTQTTQCYSSSAIGDGAYLTLTDHTNGLATLGRLGVAIPQTFIDKITDSSGKVIYNWTQPKGNQVIQPDTAYIMDNMLSDPAASYLPSADKFQNYKGWDIAVKTGTTNDEYDALMTSWSTQYTVTSWVGYHTRNVALTAGLSEAVTEPLTKGLQEGALSMLNQAPVNWTQPAGIKNLPAFVQSSHIDYGDEEPGPKTDLYPSWYTGNTSTNATVQTIDKVSGNLATSCTPALAKETVGGQNQSKFSIDLFWPIGTNVSSTTSSLVTSSDTIHQCGDQQPVIDPPSSLSCTGGTCSADTNVTQGTHPLTSGNYPLQVNAIVNGTTIGANCTWNPSMDPSNPPQSANGVCSFPYSGSGNLSVAFEAIDSVLYSNTSSTATTEIPALSQPTVSGSNVTFNFTGTGTTTVSVNGGSSTSCSGSSTCSVNLGPGSYSASAIDSSGNQSPSVNFSVQ